ncbi:MAG: ATP-binding protein [Candidatus Omnitrophica bacterium]|nr:ATP-binding protein [Candidatus Omnitrophota bacterium]
MKVKPDFILEQAPWPALLVEDTATVRNANQAAVRAFGSVVEGDSSLLSNLWAPENPINPEQFLVCLDRSAPVPDTLLLKVRGGATIPFRSHPCAVNRDGRKYFILQLFREPSGSASGSPGPAKGEAQPVEAVVAQKQKLDCALQMIRSVVLDFNNALTSILGHTSLMLHKMEAGHPWRNSLVEVEKSAERAAEIAHDLAAFSRQDKDSRSLTAGNLNELLRSTVELFQGPGSPTVQWDLKLESQLYAVRFDEAKMQQAIVKVLENAVEAVGKDARIAVRSCNLDVTEERRDGTATLNPGYYVSIETWDNGPGIAPDVLPRIFEPFFTTKPNRRGLGLAWVYGIVTNHGGSVTVSSQLGQGTTVRIYLPATRRYVTDRPVKGDELSGDQSILLVDDEVLMLTMGQMVLSAFGYRVLTASSAEEALEMFSQTPDKFDLVITDLVMPSMSGRELIEQLRRLAPRVRTLCCSGYARPAGPDEDETYLEKPFTSQQLLRKVKQVLS